MENAKQRNSLFGPVLLIGLGILFLLSNFGLLNLDFGTILSRFWPLLLIAIGLDILLGRRSGVGGLLAILLLVGVVIGSFGWGGNRWAATGSGETRTIRQALEGAKQAEITLAPGVGQFLIDSAPATDALIEGTIVLRANERLEEAFEQEDGVARYTLRSKGSGFTLPFWSGVAGGQWQLRLSQEIPLNLSVSTGVSEATLDLERLQLTGLNVNTGVGDATITLPGRGDFRVEIDGGVGTVTILIPDSLAARIEANTGIGSVDVEGDFMRNDQVYTSANYADADNRVEIEVDGGVGSITIRQIEKQ